MFVFHNMKYSAVFFADNLQLPEWRLCGLMGRACEPRSVRLSLKIAFTHIVEAFSRGAQVFALNVTTSEIDNENGGSLTTKDGSTHLATFQVFVQTN